MRAVVAYSHYNDSLAGSGLRGRSRNWGDASDSVQNAVVSEVLRQGRQDNWSRADLAFALGVVRVESGFNPDAAARNSSAAGIGQFTNATARAFGLRDPFDLRPAVSALLAYLGTLLKEAKRQLGGAGATAIYARSYGLYHDGPGLNHGGEDLARRSVLPAMEKFERWMTLVSLRSINHAAASTSENSGGVSGSLPGRR